MFANMDYVYEVYKEGSFSKAAANLYISQPALSATVKKIEKKIGMPLFDRSTVPVQLTECGKKYMKTAEKILDLEEDFQCYVGNLNELRTGRLTIGGTYLFISFVLPPIVKKFKERFPKIKLNLVEANTSQIEKKLFSGEIDLMLDNYPMDEEIYDKRFFMKEALLLAVPASFESNKAAGAWGMTSEDIRQNVHLNPEVYGVALKLFENDPFLMLRSHNDTRERVDAICRRAGFTPKVAFKMDQILSVLSYTEREMGISIVSDTVVKGFPYNRNMIYYKIDDPAAQRNVYFYYRKNKYFTKSMAEFMKVAVEEKAIINKNI